MARLEQESLTKTSSKFESFLKRNLPEVTLGRIRGYESCIVCSEKENKAFKYAVLSDEYLYLTENPPKNIQEAVPFQNISDIQLVEDYPDFLSGEERLNTMHIQVTYTITVTKSSRLGKGRSDPLAGLKETSQNLSSTLEEGGDSTNNSSGELELGRSLDETKWRDYQAQQGDNGSLSGESRPVASRTVSGPAILLNGRSKGKKKGKKSPKQVVLISPEDEVDMNSRNVEMLSKSAGELRNLDQADGSLLSAMRLGSADSRRSNESLGSDSGSVKEIKRKVILHLYMLKANSNMFVLIKSAKDNYTIRSTLLLDPDYAQRLRVSPRRSTQHVEKVEQLFLQLSKELLESSHSMEQTFQLLQELKVATEKNFSLKKLFWKSPDLFSFCIQQLQRYLPKSPTSMDNEDAVRARRADEFELIILVIETLGLMFQETEIFPARLRALRANGGRAAYSLITCLTCFPELPQKYRPLTQKAAKLLMTTQTDKWNCLTDAELHELYLEFGHVATAVVYELIQIAQQSNWGRANEGSFFSVCWIIKILEDLNTTEKFIERIITQSMTFIQPSKRVELTPSEAILVLQQFTILHTIMSFSPPLAMYIRNNYSEEFKYYIQGAVLHEKLPSHYPTSAATIKLIAGVMSAVLEKKCILNLDSSF